MYLGSYAYWLHKLAQQGIHCAILSVEYPLAPEHPFPAAVEAAAGVIEWLMQESGETVPYVAGGLKHETVTLPHVAAVKCSICWVLSHHSCVAAHTAGKKIQLADVIEQAFAVQLAHRQRS